MSGYIGAIPTPQATQSRDVYTATSNQTTFTTQGYTPGFVSVYLNGVHLARADFTATNGSDVVLASGATANDTVEIVSFGTFQSADALPLTGGTVTGTVNFPDGSISISDLDIDGGTDIGAALVDADLMVVDDGAGGTNRKATMSRLATYMGTKISGGSQTFTASGSISAGALVGLNIDGTISTMGANAGDPVQVNATNFTGAHDGTEAIVYDTANNKVIYFYRDQQNSGYLTCRVGTVSGTSISFGTAVAISQIPRRMKAVYDTNAQRAVCVFRNESDANHAYAVVVSVSGTTPTFGTQTEFYGGVVEALDICYDSNANKCVIVYKHNDDSVLAKVATVSGTSISFGSAAGPSGATCNSYTIRCEFDSNSNKVVAQWNDYDDYEPFAAVGTVSGTSISWGSETTIDSGATTANRGMSLAFDSNSNKFLHVYSVGSILRARVGTVSGTSISFGTKVTLTAVGSSQANALVFDSNKNQMVLFYEAQTTDFGNVIKGQISGTSFFAGEAATAVEINVQIGGLVFDPDTNQCITFFQNDSNYNATSSIINSGNPTWVGIAAESISDGASGKVTVIGGINTNQSSLVTGAVYGLPVTATALTAGASNAIGVALSSSSLYINTGKF